jgi:thioester reductase-like protein
MTGDVLITGATGLIGGEIALRLMKAGRRVWCVIRSGTFAEAAARLEPATCCSSAPLWDHKPGCST